MADEDNYSVALDADTAMEFEFEEEQVMRGVNLQYSDKMDEAEEFFEGLKTANARFSLHHAEVAVFKALMSNDLDDITAAITLLSEAEALASQMEHKWRTHSRMKKVNAAMSKLSKTTSALKSWALSKVSKKVAAEKAAIASSASEASEDAGPTPGSREEKVQRQRARRVRLRALQIQAECALMTALLQMIAAGESWTNMVKAGYNIKRTWSIFHHCKNKLAQINRDWVALGGSVANAGPEFFAEGYEDADAGNDDSDHEDEEWQKNMEKMKAENKEDKKEAESALAIEAPPTATLTLIPESKDSDDFGDFATAQEPKSLSSEDEFGEFKGETTTKENKTPKRTSSGKVFPDVDVGGGMPGLKADDGKLAVLDNASGVKEDAELASLRVGVNFGIGLFNVMMSLIPPQYQKVLEVLGFPADRDEGLKLLNEVSHTRTCRAPLASLMLLQYHMVIMGLLPRSPVHDNAAEKLLQDLPPNWKDSSLFKVLSSRHARYEGRLTEATEMVKTPSLPPASAPVAANSCSARMRNVILNEQGWCMLLSGDFAKAADCFGALYKDTTTFKIHFACLQSACLWEAGPEFQAQAAGILRDIIVLANAKKSKQGPVESYAIHMATTFITTQSAPLFPALELAAMYNGIQNMEKASLEHHLARVTEALHTRCQRSSQVNEEISKDVGSELVGSLLSSTNEDEEDAPSPKTEARGGKSPSGRSSSAGGKASHNHDWSESSKMLCRFLMGVIQKSLGLKDKAEDSLRYVVVAGENIPGNASPYSCYELGSMLLGTPETVLDGMKLLEKSITYPPHEFQGRLKFVVTERIRMYRESLPATSYRSSIIKK